MQAVPRIMGSMALATQEEKTMNPRQIKAVEIASRFKIQEKEGKWVVPSQSKSGTYAVGLNGTPRCTCPRLRHSRCRLQAHHGRPDND